MNIPKINKNNKHEFIFLFDLDGTILSERIHAQVYEDAVKKLHPNLSFSWEEYLTACNQKKYKGSVREYLFQNKNLTREEANEIRVLKGKNIVKTDHEIIFMDGFKNLFKKIKEHNINWAVVTNAPETYTNFVRKNSDLLNSTTQWLPREKYKLAKPNSDPYDTAVRLFKKPEEKYIIGFENSINGINAIKQVANVVFGCYKESHCQECEDIILFKDYNDIIDTIFEE